MMWLHSLNICAGIGLIVLSVIVIANTQANTCDPAPFSPNDEEKDHVKFGGCQSNIQLIYMDENIDRHIAIAFLNYKGSEQPKIAFDRPNQPTPGNEALGAVIDKHDTGKWALIITILQDYESMAPPYIYYFNVYFGDAQAGVNLKINNIDDEAPTIILRNPCGFEENKVGLSSCIYDISDADGIMENFVKYTITDAEGVVSDTFSIKNIDEISNGMKKWQVSLEILQCMDFESISIYVLDFIVTDSGNNNGTAKIIVEVIDMPDEPPIWKKIFPSIQLDEKQTQTYQVEAVDGDIMIDDPVNYHITATEYAQFFEIERTTGLITVHAIDRDELQQQMFSFKVTAYEVYDPSWHINQSVTVIVNDINDHSPVVTVTPESRTISIPENSATKLSFEIDVVDPDLGENGTFRVELTDDESEYAFNSAFQIIPDQGYQKAQFTIAVINSTLLDFEDKPWQKIKFDIYCEEIANTSHTESISIHVNLENLNDELPLFDEENYEARWEETIPEGTLIGIVHATDRDIDDKVTHTLLGTNVNILFKIDEVSGEIYTKVNNSIDYERETETIIQVQAMDQLHEIHHRNITDFKIIVIDVNDEKPTIIIPPGGDLIKVEENREHATVINDDFPIIATDADTEADVQFYIDWENSYAKKEGKPVDEEEYIGCIGVNTISNGNGGNVSAQLWINENKKNNTPDYEKFDQLFIALVAEDTNQTLLPKTDTVIIPIEIIDLNDNEPIFDMKSVLSRKTVTEHSDEGTFIATVFATDADGPLHNIIEYEIERLDPTIPTDWIRIDKDRGDIYVNSPDIDADGDATVERPQYWNLTYIVRAINEELRTEVEILINVTDINDNKPILEAFDEIVEIYEASPDDTHVQTFRATDIDRDEEYHTPWFQFSEVTPETRDFFSIDLNSGRVSVHYKTNKVLDRDFGTPNFAITILYGDNYHLKGGTQFVNHTSFTIVLKDINNQKPLIMTENVDALENCIKGQVIGEVIAEDADEPGSINAQIKFAILSIEKPESLEEVEEDLFTIATDKDFLTGIGKLTTNYNLKQRHGVYKVRIHTTDFGEYPDGPLTDSKDISVHIKPYNFESPSIIYPNDKEKIYLRKDQRLDEILIDIDGNDLKDFSATDNQGDKWNLKFRIANDGSGDDFPFTIKPIGLSTGSLRLTKLPNKEVYDDIQIIVDCECVGDEPKTDSVTISVRFQDAAAEPSFETLTQEVSFYENETGLNNFAELEKACWIADDCDRYSPYYFFVDHSSCQKGEFLLGRSTIDENRPILTVVEMLDRETVDTYTLRILASRRITGNTSPPPRSILNITVTVLDVNDNPPNFDEKYYSGVVKPTDPIDMKILNVSVTDLDIDDSWSFYIEEDSIIAEGNGIQNIDSPFKVEQIKEKQCNILLNFPVQSIMSGYFSFDLKVKDAVNHTDTAEVRIYIVSEDSRTIFSFNNTLEEVEPKQDEIKLILEDEYEYICNIEKVQAASKKDAYAEENKVDVLVHFIRPNDSSPVDKDEIIRKSSDPAVFGRLEQNFRKQGLILDTFNIDRTVKNLETMFRSLLIGVSIGLGTLIVFLVILFVCKVRSLNRRLNNLSETKFGSQESGLNRMGIAAPGTNKHAVEGSNPVYNEDKKMPELDYESIGSGDSDLIGIEDNPNFAYNGDWETANHHTTKASDS